MSPRLSSPTTRLMFGLAVTLGAVGIFSWYALQQIAGLKDLQTQLVDRNRRDSLQLLRIQNNLHSLGLAMRDMVNGDEPYPLQAWKGQFDRIRVDLEDALRLEREMAPAVRGVTGLLTSRFASLDFRAMGACLRGLPSAASSPQTLR